MSASDRISIRPMCFGTYTPYQRADRACGSCKSAADCIPPKEELTMAGNAKPASDQPIKKRAPDFLHAALGHMQDRAKTYDKPQGERSMEATVAAFNAITGHALTEQDGWMLMICLKAVRSRHGKFRADSFEDGAAYFGLMGESAIRAQELEQ